MSDYGSIALKKRYLGAPYPGQELNYCRIEVAENAVCVIVMKSGFARQKRFIDNQADVLLLKAKLRGYLQRMKGKGRWSWTRVNSTTVYMMIYYPSVSWGSSFGNVRLFCRGEAF